MEENAFSEQKGNFSQQIKNILAKIGLEIAGFALLTDISEAHLYALSNGNKDLTDSIADKIADPLKLKSVKLLLPNYEIPDSIADAPAVKKFYKTYGIGNPEYFTNTKALRKNAFFIDQELIQQNVFSEPLAAGDVRIKCAKLGVHMTSKEASQHLSYFAIKKKLKKEKVKMRKKNGEISDREIYVYSNNSHEDQ